MENKTSQTIEQLLENLVEHEKKIQQLIEILSKKVTELSPEELTQYGAVSIHDKRSQNLTNFGHIIKQKMGMNGLEITTDRGYTLCLLGDCMEGAQNFKTELKGETHNLV
jgi:hypothetical protein